MGQEQNAKMRVWWVPQVPSPPTFYVDVVSVEEGAKLLVVLADYDLFQFENKIKLDYSNAGGLEVFEDGGWTDWWDEESGEDDPVAFVFGDGVDMSLVRD